MEDIHHNLKVGVAYEPVQTDTIQSNYENLELVVEGLSNEECMNLMFESDIDPAISEKVFEERSKAEELLVQLRSLIGNNAAKIKKFREDHKIEVYDPNPKAEDPKKQLMSKKVEEVIEIIREEGLKNWITYKETGVKPTKADTLYHDMPAASKPTANLTIPTPEVYSF